MNDTSTTPEGSSATPKRSLDIDEDLSSSKRLCLIMRGDEDLDESTMAHEPLSPPIDYSEDCDVYLDKDIAATTKQLAKAVNDRIYLAPEVMHRMANWLHTHLESTENAPAQWLAGYTANSDFWGSVSTFAVNLVSMEDIFQSSPASMRHPISMIFVLHQFYHDALTLTLRHLSLLYDEPEKAAQHVVKVYAAETAGILLGESRMFRFLYSERVLDSSSLDTHLREHLSKHPSAVQSLLEHIDHISTANHITGPQSNVAQGLCLLLPRILQVGLAHSFGDDHEEYLVHMSTLENVLTTLAADILPAGAISGAKRASQLIAITAATSIQHMMELCLEKMYPKDVRQLYQLGIDHLACFNDKAQSEDIERLVVPQNDSRVKLYTQQMWILFTILVMSSADSVDMRLKAISHLRTTLRRQADRGNSRTELVTAICKICMICSVPHRIYGADAHVAIVQEAKDIMLQLAKLGLWTEELIDAIWTTWNNSSQEDIRAQITTTFLQCVPELSTRHVHHILRKYNDLHSSKLTNHLSDLLAELLVVHNLRQQNGTGGEAYHILTAQVCINVIQQVCDSGKGDKLFNVAQTGLLNTIRSASAASFVENFSIDHLQTESGMHAAALEIGMMLLSLDTSTIDHEQYLHRLPVQAMIERFCQHIEHTAQLPPHHNGGVRGFRNCAELIVRAIDANPEAVDSAHEHQFWQYAVGQKTRDPAARDDTLRLFSAIQNTLQRPELMLSIIERHIDEYTEVMELKAVTRGLLIYMRKRLVRALDDAENNFEAIAHTPQWQKVMQIAYLAPDRKLCAFAEEIVCDSLFHTYKGKPALDIEHLQAFIELQMQQAHAVTDPRKIDSQALQKVLGVLRLLKTIHDRCQRMTPPKYQDLSIKSSADNDNDQQSQLLKLKVSSTTNVITEIELKMPADATFKTLLAHLRKEYGAEDYDIINWGTRGQMSDRAETKLSDVRMSSQPPLLVPIASSGKAVAVQNSYQSLVIDILRKHQDLLHSLLEIDADVADATSTLLHELNIETQWSAINQADGFPHGSAFAPDAPWHCLHSLRSTRRDLAIARHEDVLDQRRIHLSLNACLQILLREEYRGLLDCHLLAAENLVWAMRSVDNESAHAAWVAIILELMKHEQIHGGNPCERMLRMLVDQLSQDRSTSEQDLDLHKHIYTLCVLTVERLPELSEGFISSSSFIDYHVRARLATTPKHNLMGHVMPEIKALVLMLPSKAVFTWCCSILPVVTKLIDTPLHAISALWLIADVWGERVSADLTASQRAAFLDGVLSLLSSYKHTESPMNTGTDSTLVHILRLLQLVLEAVIKDKGHLELDLLVQDIFHRLLFSINERSRPHQDQMSRYFATSGVSTRVTDLADVGQYNQSLMTEQTRDVCYDILALPICSIGTREQILRSLHKVINNWMYDPDPVRPTGRARSSVAMAGLTNLGMTCYMNSLLQQIFGNLAMRGAILQALPSDNPESQQFLFLLQSLFAEMQDSSRACIDTAPLAKHMNIATNVQEDAHSFWTIMLSAIEDAFEDQQAKSNLTSIYTGESLTQVKADCGHISTKIESYSDIALPVQNKRTLEDSLSEFVAGEAMQGADCYRCTTCQDGGKLVEAVRRTCFRSVPDTVVFSLKRFTFDMTGRESKNDDRFEFPDMLDMAPFQLHNIDRQSEDRDPDVFRLTGVIVHSGSMVFGHYWSYVFRKESLVTGGAEWYRLEDHKTATRMSFSDLTKEFYGGDGQSHSAYVLFYERESALRRSIEELRISTRPTSSVSPLQLKISVPNSMAAQIHVDNAQQARLDNMTARGLQVFIAKHLEATTSMQPNEPASFERHHLNQALAELSMSYLRGVLSTFGDVGRLDAFLKSIATSMHHQQSMTTQLLQAWLKVPDFTEHVYKMNRPSAAHILVSMLAMAQQYQLDHDGQLLRHALKAFCEPLSSGVISAYYPQWYNYFLVLHHIGRIGPAQIEVILELEFFQHASAIVNNADDNRGLMQDGFGIPIPVVNEHILMWLRAFLIQVHNCRFHEARIIERLLQDLVNSELTWLVHGLNMEAPDDNDALVDMVRHILKFADMSSQHKICQAITSAFKSEVFEIDRMAPCIAAICTESQLEEVGIELLNELLVQAVDPRWKIDEDVILMLDQIRLSKPHIVVMTTHMWLETFLGPKASNQEHAADLIRDTFDTLERRTPHEPLESQAHIDYMSFAILILDTSMLLLHQWRTTTDLPDDYKNAREVLVMALDFADTYDDHISRRLPQHFDESQSRAEYPELVELCSRLMKAAEEAKTYLDDFDIWTETTDRLSEVLTTDDASTRRSVEDFIGYDDE